MRGVCRERTVGALRLALAIAAFAAVGWNPVGSAASLLPEQLAPNTAVRVSEVPKRLGTITKVEFRHALGQVAAAEGHSTVPKPGGRGYEQLVHPTIDALLEAVWLKGQAAEMDVRVTHRQVVRERTRLKKENFESAAEYRKFLREARYTHRDIYERVELQLLSMRIQRRIEKRVRSKSEEQKVFDEFVAAFNKRWRARTVCAPAYVTPRCSNGPTRSR